MDIEPFSLRLAHPLDTAAGTIQTRDGFVVRTSLDGVPGIGEATPLPGWTESHEVCKQTLERIDDPVEALTDSRLRETPAARHGVSLGVLDARARATGRPLYRELGRDEAVESLPVNATVGDGSVSKTAEAVERAATEGYPAVKVKIGARTPSVDVDRLEAVRSACPDIELRVDVNGAWDESTADDILPDLAELDVSILEQPLPANRLEAHGRLRGRGVEIALDEGCITHGISSILEADAADLVVCKPMALGGVDVTRDAMLSARTVGVDAIVTTTIDGTIARTAAVHLAASVPDMRACGLATGGFLESDLGGSTTDVTDGAIAVPQGKGNIPPPSRG